MKDIALILFTLIIGAAIGASLQLRYPEYNPMSRAPTKAIYYGIEVDPDGHGIFPGKYVFFLHADGSVSWVARN